MTPRLRCIPTLLLTLLAVACNWESASDPGGAIAASVTSSCKTSTQTWQNTALPSQAGTFTASFDATPSASPIDGPMGLSKLPAAAYTDLATIVRFNTLGNIDSRNGGTYMAASTIPYVGGKSYHFRLEVNVTAHTFSAYVTPAGSSEVLVGLNYAFRTEQNTITSIANMGFNAAVGSVTVCDPVFAINGCPTSGYTRLVNVSTMAQLTAAAATNALAGDQIRMAAGTYAGRVTTTKNGTAAAPITVCGPRTAILDGPDLTGTGFYLNGADYWTLKGFTVLDNLAGVAAKNGANFNRFDSLDVHGQGQAGIVIKQDSKHNTIWRNQVHHTGVDTAQFGEGVYIGTTESQWVGGIPDHSDSTLVYGNHVYDNGADNVQSMAGTTGTIIRRDTLDGSSFVNYPAAPPHWVLAMGNNMIVDSNVATNADTHGMKIRQSTTATGWGLNNFFQANTMTMNTGGLYYAIYKETAAPGLIVKCDNVRTDAGAMTNVTCTP